ncbi:MAG: AI-2E family transporter [Terracidiphilus sp.]|nr:AI-2E family transporter [Terracidiphilus sp.]
MTTTEPDSGAFDWSGLTLFLLSIGVVALCGLIVWPFLPGIVGAVILAVVAAPLNRWLRRRVRQRTVAASLALAAIFVSVVIPLLLVGQAVGRHVFNLARDLQANSAASQAQALVAAHPRIQSMVVYAQQNLDGDQMVEKSLGQLASRIGPLVGQSISAAFQIGVLVFLLFFLFRDDELAVATLRSYLPLSKEESGFLLVRLRASINALVLGRFAVAAIQGLLAGVLYAALGVGGSALLGVATMLCAMIPAVGAILIWLPVAIYLALVHQWVQAIILVAVGSLVISSIDNFLYPVFVGSRLRLHTVPIFLSMLGGVFIFGVVGLVLGPVVFNVASILALIWRSRTRGEPLPADG